jgi:hypothetical protein
MKWVKQVLKDHYKVSLKKAKSQNKFNKKYVIRKVKTKPELERRLGEFE